ncbi:MAG: hypothetical protein HZB39_12925 [Planctomycetes bacterium]|nr:hypothetical protein [Planctomycetota bacterium]
MTPRSRADAGFSMLEATIVFLIVTLLTGMISQSLMSLSRNQRWSERQTGALGKAEQLVHGIQNDLEVAVRVFPESAASRAVLARLALGESAPIEGSRMPLATSRGWFEPDAPGAQEAGNLLVLARSLPAIEVGTGYGSQTARIDRYQFVVYCLTLDGARLDIDRWASVPLARADDIAAVFDPDARANVVMGLLAAGVPLAWRPEDPVIDTSLYEMSPTGSAPRLGTNVAIPAGNGEIRRHLLERAKLGVARNGRIGAVRVPAYAHDLPGHPHGFEIKLDGDGAGRLLLVRLVVAGEVRPGEPPVASAVERLVSVREP